jgi:hypothetical protein
MDLSICLAGPIPNTDISGIGSRLAMYCQNAVLGELRIALTRLAAADEV